MNQEQEKIIEIMYTEYFLKTGFTCKDYCKKKINKMNKSCIDKCMLSSYIGLQSLNKFIDSLNKK